MPQAIEWSFATPKISAFLPSSRPISSSASRPEHSRYASPMTTVKPTLAAAALAKALEGVRALLLDLDGVIVVAGEAVPGSPEAIAKLEARGFPYRIVTNTSAVSRATLARWSVKIGAPIPASRFQSALSASAAWTARHFPGAPLYVLASEDAQTEFAGQRLLTHEEAGARGASAAAVVIGDSPEEVTFDNMNRAFRLVRGGAVARRHAPEPMVADAGRAHARLRCVRRGPRVRDRDPRPHRRQAPPGVLLRGDHRPSPRGRPRPRPRRHRDGRRRRPLRRPSRTTRRPARHLRPVRQARDRTTSRSRRRNAAGADPMPSPNDLAAVVAALALDVD